MNEHIQMKGRTLPWVTTTNTTLKKCWRLLPCCQEQWSFHMCSVLQDLRDQSCQSSINLTHTITPIPLSLWSHAAVGEKSKNLNTHILLNIHRVVHMPLFQLHPNCWEATCHVSHTLTIIYKCPLMAERTVYVSLYKWPHTCTQPISMYSAFTDMFSHSMWDWIEISQVCARLMVFRNWSEMPSLLRTLTYQAEPRDMAGQHSSTGICLVCTVDMFTVEWKLMCRSAWLNF